MPEAEMLENDRKREQEGRLKRQVPLQADILYSGEALVLTFALSVGLSTLKIACFHVYPRWVGKVLDRLSDHSHQQLPL